MLVDRGAVSAEMFPVLRRWNATRIHRDFDRWKTALLAVKNDSS